MYTKTQNRIIQYNNTDERKDRYSPMKAFLILEDGTVFEGTSIGSTREVISEIVFNTSMTGYLEIGRASCRERV